MKKFLRNTLTMMAVLLLGGIFASPARGQFIGYTAPQTVNQQIFSAVNTTQTSPVATFPCAPVPAGTGCGIPNIGQSIHYVTFRASSTGKFKLTLQGSNDGSTWFDMAESGSDTGLNGGTPGFAGFAASGSFASYRLNLVFGTPSSGSLSVWYSGTSVSNGSIGGTLNLSAQYRRVLALAPDTSVFIPTGGVGNGVPVYPIAGNTAGTFYFQFITNNCAGASITVSAGPDANHINTLTTISPVNNTNLQTFAIPPLNAGVEIFNYTACGTETYDAYVQFAPQGISGGQGTNAQQVQTTGADPCNSTATAKSSAVINVTSATTTQLVALVAGQSVYVCGVSMTIAPSATTADTATLEYGTGASCGTGTTTLTGAFGAGDLTTAAPPLYVTFADPGTTVKTPAGNALCLLSAGTTVNIQGILTYVQQ